MRVFTTTVTCTAASENTAGQSRCAICRRAGCDQSSDGMSGTPRRRSSGSWTRNWPSPPTSTPTPRARMGGLIRGPSPSTAPIIATLRMAGASAAVKKR